MPIVQQRKHIAVKGTLNGANGILRMNINLSFHPDVVIMKNAFEQTGGQDLGYIHSSMIESSEVFCPMADSNTNPIALEHDLQGPIAGTYDFLIKNIDGTPRTGLTGNLLIMLEFVKYSKRPY